MPSTSRIQKATRSGRQALPRGAVLAAGLLLFPALGAGAENVDATTLNQRYARVVQMSSVERERLQRNLATFQKLTPEQQDRYRRMTADLNEDRNAGGSLGSLMETYSGWIKTLTPGQREELRQETDSAKKLALVRKFKDDQARDSFNSSPLVESFQQPPGPMRPPPRLSIPELNSVINVLLKELPEEDQKEIGRVNRVDQHPDVIRRSVQQADDPREWPSKELEDKMLAVMPPPLRNFVRNNHKRETLLKLVFLSISSHKMDEMRPKWPTDSELNQLAEGLDADQQSMLDQKSAEDRRQFLTTKFFERHPDRMPQQVDEMRHKMDALIERLGINVMPPPRRFSGEGPPRPGDRGPGDRGDRGPGDRRPDDRGPGERGPDDRPPGGRYFGPGEPPPFPPGERPGREGRPDNRRDGRPKNRKEPE